VTGKRPRRRSALRVRDLEWGDFPDLVRTYWHLYDERAAGQPHGIMLARQKPSLSEEVEWFCSFYRHVLTGEFIALVAEVNGEAVGSCTVRRLVPDEAGHVGELGILVRAGHRGQGIGSALMRAAIARSRRKFEMVRLSVQSDNVGARRLYERCGFRWVGAYPRAVRRGGKAVDSVLMVLDFAHPTRARSDRPSGRIRPTAGSGARARAKR
jgi:RimJ/RimL family protein N-acetyltransferase